MLGRGVDQALRYKNDPTLHESYVKDARDYLPPSVKTFVESGGYIAPRLIWENLLNEPLYQESALRIVNLETSITISSDYAKKGINYRLHPKNVDAVEVPGFDYLNLANNHTMDYGLSGLEETMEVLEDVDYGGVGFLEEARRPTIIGDYVIFSIADVSSGVPSSWKATRDRQGVNLIDIRDQVQVSSYTKYIANHVVVDALVIVSIHCGSNWGWEPSQEHKSFCRSLIDAGVSLIHGHSSHHFRGIERYKNGIIFYGCGDLLNDYEIIEGHEEFFPHTVLAYFLRYEDNQFKYVKVIPYTINNLRLERIEDDAALKKLRSLSSGVQIY